MAEIDFDKLKEPFNPEDIEWRVQSSGKKDGGKIWAKVLAYVTNRAIMDRLDAVATPGNWRNEFTKAPDGGILCGLSIKIDGEWVTKWDGASNTSTEAVKGGLSSAMKRAAVQWGIGRYLYNLEAGWADIVERYKGMYSGKVSKCGTYFDWNPPRLPSWALPQGTDNTEAKGAPQREVDNQTDPTQHQPSENSESGGQSQNSSQGQGNKPKSGWFVFLETMQGHKKRLGDDIYYQILGNEGYSKSNEIPEDNVDLQKKIHLELKEIPF